MRRGPRGTLNLVATQGREAMTATARMATLAALGAIVALPVAGAGVAQAGQFALPTVQTSSAGVTPVGDGVSTTATCPRSTSLISGGFATSLVDTHGPVVIDASAADRDNWQASANEYGGGPDSFTALANCARGAPPEHPS